MQSVKFNVADFKREIDYMASPSKSTSVFKIFISYIMKYYVTYSFITKYMIRRALIDSEIAMNSASTDIIDSLLITLTGCENDDDRLYIFQDFCYILAVIKDHSSLFSAFGMNSNEISQKVSDEVEDLANTETSQNAIVEVEDVASSEASQKVVNETQDTENSNFTEIESQPKVTEAAQAS